MDEESEPVVILFADVCGGMDLYQSLGDSEASRVVANCLGDLGVITRRHGGTVIKTIGDEIMVEFPTPDLAAGASIAMQTQRRREDPLIKIGFHVGPVTRQDGDLFGDAVNVAAQVVNLARGREVLMTLEAVTAMSAPHRDRVVFFDSTTVRGISRSIALFRYPTEVAVGLDGPVVE
jgi:adenylate cyclase